MRKTTALTLLFLAIVSTGRAGADDRAAARGEGPPRLPKSLDALYPPAADRPLYLFGMLAMNTPFAGIVADLMEDDLEGAKGCFEDFRAQYREVARMVPEWRGEYEEKTVEDLGAALAAGDKALAMKAVAAVGGTCHRCHRAAMVPVQQKFRWGAMGAMTVNDPPSGAPTPYGQFKSYLAANFAGIAVDLKQGQADNARRQFDGFKARFRALTDSCRGCHDGASRPYVDSEAQDTVDRIGRALASRAPDADAVTSLLRKIGSESCSKCHLVHVPAAMAGISPR